MAKKKVKKAKAKDGAWLYNELTTVRFTVRSKTFEIDIGSELLVSSEDLHGQVERIPALMGYFSTVVSLLEEEYENKKDLKKTDNPHIKSKNRVKDIIKRIINLDLELSKLIYSPIIKISGGEIFLFSESYDLIKHFAKNVFRWASYLYQKLKKIKKIL